MRDMCVSVSACTLSACEAGGGEEEREEDLMNSLCFIKCRWFLPKHSNLMNQSPLLFFDPPNYMFRSEISLRLGSFVASFY